MVKKQYSEEGEYKEDVIPKVELKHFTEDCQGKFVEEYAGANHCPVCGSWAFDKKGVS